MTLVRRLVPAILVVPLLLAALLSSGCASRLAQARKDVPTVLKVQINGNKAFADGAIRSGLAQRQTSVLHFIPPFTFFQPRYYLEGTDWQDDRTRIANFYAVRGYFDARVISSQTVPRGKERRANGDPKFVKVVHTVAEGPASTLRTITVELDDAELQAILVDRLPLRLEQRFSVDETDAAEAAIISALHDRGYATAAVDTRIDAYPEEEVVDLTFAVTPGPIAVFGEVQIRGLDKVAERYVRRHVLVKPGADWDGSVVRRMQRAIYGMGVFSMVTVTPDLSNDHGHDAGGRAIVPIDIALKERKPRSFEYSPGFAWDTQGFTLKPADITFSHINLGGRLVQAELNLTGGYRYLAATDHFPTASASVELKWPDFPARRFNVRIGSEIELGLEKGYKFWTPSARAGIGWAPLQALKFDVSYNLAFFDLFDAHIGPVPTVPSPCPEVGKLPGNCDPPSDTLVPDFPDNYLLSYFRETVVLDLRDNPLAADKGFLAQISVDQAFPFGRLASGELRGFRYVKLSGELRAFIPVVAKRIVLGLRAGGAHLATWGDEHNLPVNQRVYLGGDGTVRGWKTRYLGPRGLEADCSTGDCIVPLGARTGVSGSVEVRARPFGGLWIAAFSDFGRTWGDGSTDTKTKSDELQALESALYQDGLAFSVGGGLRYDLSIGRVRIDFAARIRKWPAEFVEIKERFPWNIHFNLGESF